MKLIWNKIARIYLTDSRNTYRDVKSFELIEKELNIVTLKSLIELKSFLNARMGFSDFLYFLKKENFCNLRTVLEVAIINNEWSLVSKLTDPEDIQFCYLGNKVKYHLHEVIFSRLLELLRENKLPPEEFKQIINLKIKPQYLGSSLYFKLKQMFAEEIKNCQTINYLGSNSPLLNNLIEFVFFLKINNLLTDDFFLFMVKESVRYKNFYVLKYLEEYFPQDFSWLVLSTMRYNFIQKIIESFPIYFSKGKYLHYVIKCYFEMPSADESELYNILRLLQQKQLDDFSQDNSMLTLIIGSGYHYQAKHLLINHLIGLKVITKNRFLIDNLRLMPKVNPLVYEALASGEELPQICFNVLGCKSFKKTCLIEEWIKELDNEKKQNQLLFSYLAIQKLKVNRDLVLNNLSLAPNLKSFSATTLQQILFILSHYNDKRKLALLLSITPGQEREIQNVFEILSIIKNSNYRDIQLPIRPENFLVLSKSLNPLKKIIQDSNVSFGLDLFEKKISALNFRNFIIKVPKNAQELRHTGIAFKNCLAVDRHSKYVSDIILRKVVVFTLENENVKYCVSIDPINHKLIEAKRQGQELMPDSLVSALEFFLREIDYGQAWI